MSNDQVNTPQNLWLHDQPYSFNNYHPMMNNNYNQQSIYNAPPSMQTAAMFSRSYVSTVQRSQITTSGQNVTSLWMGNLEPYMTKSFIREAFIKMGEFPISIKLRQNKTTFITAGYAFVNFCYDSVHTMHKLNGKYIPGSNPPVRFKLNHTKNSRIISASDTLFSVWLGELSSDVDDYQLYEIFARRYQSIRTAKVVLDKTGYSKGYGFIHFHNEEDQKHCLNNMNGFLGLGSKPIKVSSVVPKLECHVVSSINDSQGYKAIQEYEQYFGAPETQNYVIKPETNIETNGKLLDDYKNHETQYYNLWEGFPNIFCSHSMFSLGHFGNC